MMIKIKNAQKQQAAKWGRVAETLCIWLLRCKGYRIYERRYRTSLGEIDIIASKRKTLIFIEVKARDSLEKGMLALKLDQQKRIGRAALLYLSKHSKISHYDCRFDAIFVRPWCWPYHLKNAWQV